MSRIYPAAEKLIGLLENGGNASVSNGNPQDEITTIRDFVNELPEGAPITDIVVEAAVGLSNPKVIARHIDTLAQVAGVNVSELRNRIVTELNRSSQVDVEHLVAAMSPADPGAVAGKQNRLTQTVLDELGINLVMGANAASEIAGAEHFVVVEKGEFGERWWFGEKESDRRDFIGSFTQTVGIPHNEPTLLDHLIVSEKSSERFDGKSYSFIVVGSDETGRVARGLAQDKDGEFFHFEFSIQKIINLNEAPERILSDYLEGSGKRMLPSASRLRAAMKYRGLIPGLTVVSEIVKAPRFRVDELPHFQDLVVRADLSKPKEKTPLVIPTDRPIAAVTPEALEQVPDILNRSLGTISRVYGFDSTVEGKRFRRHSDRMRGLSIDELVVFCKQKRDYPRQ